MTHLTDAAAQNNIDAAKNLLAKNPDDVNKKADAGVYEGFTPLMIAAGLDNLEMVDLLFNYKADVFIMDSRMGTTALHKAAQRGSVEVAERLLNEGAFIDAQAPTLGNTPLLDAVWHQHPAMVKCLLDRGARTELTTRSGGKPIDTAKSDKTKSDKKREIIDLLNEAEASRTQQIADQKLMAAVEANDLHTVDRLIHEYRVEKLIRDKVDERAPKVGRRFDGYTPLLAAAFLGHDGIVQKLLDDGADPQKVDDQIKATAGHKAGYHGCTKAAQRLVKDRRLDLDAQGPYNGYTALHDAIWHCHKETVGVFLDAGARLDLRTHTGHTPLELAKFYCRCCPEIETLIQIADGIKTLDELAVGEYGKRFAEVAESLGEENGGGRLYYGRLLGILVKEPFSKLHSAAELAGAKRRWELLPEKVKEESAQHTWQFHLITRLQQESLEYSVENYSSLDAMLQEVKRETGFFWHLLRSMRKYVCKDPEFCRELDKTMEKARQSGTAVSLPSASIAATLATMLATQLPWLAIVSAPLIAGIVILLWQIGADAFCNWSNDIIADKVWNRDS